MLQPTVRVLDQRRPPAGSPEELAMLGIVTLRLGKPIDWDSAALKVKGEPAADLLVNRPQRKKWL